jgi:hypothetical protein
MTVVLVLLFLAIVASLGHAMFSMTSGPSGSAQVVRALTVRISLSIVLFLAILAGFYFGG